MITVARTGDRANVCSPYVGCAATGSALPKHVGRLALGRGCAARVPGGPHGQCLGPLVGYPPTAEFSAPRVYLRMARALPPRTGLGRRPSLRDHGISLSATVEGILLDWHRTSEGGLCECTLGNQQGATIHVRQFVPAAALDPSPTAETQAWTEDP